MVLSAVTALSLTEASLNLHNAQEVQQEVTLAEARITTAAGLGFTKIEYNALIIGNPIGNPQIPTNLANANQADFLAAFNSAGYIVSWDSNTGFWVIDWTTQGPETLVSVYSFRTIVAPGAIYLLTIAAIEGFFTDLMPTVTSKVTSDANIDPTQFGAPASLFYEYTIVCTQNGDTTDHSAAVKTALVATGLGYDTFNCGCFKLI